jgi:hypothetical protein
LLHGSYRSLAAPEGVFAYLREVPGESLLVALNFTDGEVRFDAVAAVAGGAADGRAAGGPAADPPMSGTLDLSTDSARPTNVQVSLRLLALGPNEGVVVRL